MHRPQGIVPPVLTPFDPDENVDTRALAAQLDYLIGAGVHGVFVLGSQGEFFALDADEKRRVAEAAVEHVAGRAPVYVGTGAVTTREAVALAKMAETAGADAISVITPYFVSPSQAELYDHFRAVAEAVQLPTILYTNPGRTGGLNVSPDTVARLAELPNMVGIKDSSGDLTQTCEYIRATPDDFAVLMGRDTLIHAGLCCGTSGAIAATANVCPELVVEIYEAYTSGDRARSLDAQRRLVPLRTAFALGTFPAVVKEAVAMLGRPAGACRRPVGGLSDDARDELRRILASMGLLAG